MSKLVDACIVPEGRVMAWVYENGLWGYRPLTPEEIRTCGEVAGWDIDALRREGVDC